MLWPRIENGQEKATKGSDIMESTTAKSTNKKKKKKTKSRSYIKRRQKQIVWPRIENGQEKATKGSDSLESTAAKTNNKKNNPKTLGSEGRAANTNELKAAEQVTANRETWGLFVCWFLKGKAKSKVMLQLMHSMCKSYSKTVVYFIHAPSVLRKKANEKQPHGAAMLSSAMT